MKKTNRYQKLLFYFLSITFGLFLYSQSVSAQITLSAENPTLGQIIKAVESQTKYQFFYSDRLAGQVMKSVSVSKVSVEYLLNSILKDTEIAYKVEDNIVYLSEKGGGQVAPVKSSKKDKVITGLVTDRTGGEALVGVSVSVKGTNTGTITGIDGDFFLKISGEQDELVFSYMGYVTQDVSLDGRSELSVSMVENVKMIDEVVVTALGIKREKRLLGYSIQEIRSDELNQAGSSSVTGALVGKVAGLQMNISPTGLNGSTKMTIRGNSSLTDNNQPLWVVDGIPFNDNSSSNAPLYGGVDRGGVSFDINPEDIESISILKGPNAAALYGSRAGNGVLLITTKKGVNKGGFGVTYSNALTWSQVASTLDMQAKYGQGIDGTFDNTSQFSFGSALDGHIHEAWTGEMMPYQRYGNKLRDYFRTGFSQTHNVSIGNVTDKSDYRFSFGYLASEGIFPNESINRINLDLKTGMEMNKYLRMDSKISLSRSKAEDRPRSGIGGEVYQLLFVPNNIRLSDLSANYVDEEGRHINFAGPKIEWYNPYYSDYQYYNQDERWRSFGFYSLKLTFAPWLYATTKYGFDYYRTKTEDMDRSNGMEVPTAKDSYNSRESNFFEHNMEFVLLGNHTLPYNMQLGYSMGGNVMYGYFEELRGISENMKRKGIWYHNSAADPLQGGLNAVEQSYWERKTRSIFGTMQLAYNNYLSLDLTGRADWSSTLPVTSNPYIYPSVNLSYDLTEFSHVYGMRFPSWIDFAKIRLSYAKAGKDTGPFQVKNYKRFRQVASGLEPIVETIKANADLKSEMKTSYEAGFDLKFFGNRLGLDFTCYYSETVNQILIQPMPRPWTGKYINAGMVSNRGVELMIYSKPVKTKDFEFGLDVNLAHNRTIVDKLAEGVSFMSFSFNGDKLLVDVGAEEGGKLGDIYGNKVYERDADGNVMLLDGSPLTDQRRKKIGNMQPDLLMSVIPSFSYKGFYFTTLFDMRFGGNIVSVSEAIATGFGTAKRTENRSDLILPGTDKSTGLANTVSIKAQKYYMSIGSKDGVAEEFIYDASYIKIKEISLGYSFPQKFLKKTPFTAFKLSLVASNLLYLLSHTPGTSPEGGFDTTMYSQVIDFTSVPYTRTFGFSMHVGF